MIRVAGERIHRLFALAEAESRGRPGGLPDRYVQLARRIGTRYNLRLPPEYRELYCRRCSAYWVEGRTVRTRLRSGRRARTCLRCGAVSRRLTREPRRRAAAAPAAAGAPAAPEEPGFAYSESEEQARLELEDEEEGE